jgi:hypothetical protein
VTGIFHFLGEYTYQINLTIDMLNGKKVRKDRFPNPVFPSFEYAPIPEEI